jgi:hypothetical protein
MFIMNSLKGWKKAPQKVIDKKVMEIGFYYFYYCLSQFSTW